MSTYQSAFFTVPSRIMNLPGITLAFLRFYETIFQFWNHGKSCYLSNDMIKERTGISSISTIMEAFKFFEGHKELKRKKFGNRRYIVQPERLIEIEEQKQLVDNTQKDCTKSSQTIAVPIDGYRCTDSQPIAVPIHNNKKINNKNINKNYCPTSVGLPKGFIEFWKIYPKKEKKRKAIEIWAKNDLEAIAAKIIAALENRVLVDYLHREHRHIPAPTTYLNGNLWEDEVMPITIKNKQPEKFINKSNEPRCTLKEFGPGHPTWEADQEWRRKHDSHGSEARRDHTGGNGVRQAKDYLLS